MHAIGRTEVLPGSGKKLGRCWVIHRLYPPDARSQFRIVFDDIARELVASRPWTDDEDRAIRLQRRDDLGEKLLGWSSLAKSHMIGFAVYMLGRVMVADFGRIELVLA